MVLKSIIVGVIATLFMDAVCQSARKTDPLSASKIDPPCDVEIRA